MKSKLQWLAGSVAALAFTVPTLAAGDRAPYSAIVVFGTSLSGSGNAFALRGGANTPPDMVNLLLDARLREVDITSQTAGSGSNNWLAHSVWQEA